jgi:hypothetical protein
MVPALIKLGIGIFIVVWCLLFYSVFNTSGEDEPAPKVNEPMVAGEAPRSAGGDSVQPVIDSGRNNDPEEVFIHPAGGLRTGKEDQFIGEPPSLAEIERNMTLYLQTLHARLQETAGPKVRGIWKDCQLLG